MVRSIPSKNRLQTLCVCVGDTIYSDASKRFAKDEDDEEDLPEAQVAPKNLWGRFERKVCGCKATSVFLLIIFRSDSQVMDIWLGLLAGIVGHFFIHNMFFF